MQARGAEFAEFIQWFIETKSMPSIRAGGGGGFSLLGWSAGNAQTLPLLAYADQLSRETQELFELYFRSFIIHGIFEFGMSEDDHLH